MKKDKNYLKQYLIVKIKGEKYTIDSLSEFENEGQIWREYLIESKSKKYYKDRWLKVRKNENNEDEYWFCEKYNGKADSRKKELEIGNIKYNYLDSGIATKKDIYGLMKNIGKKECDYTDFISDDLKKRISIQRSEGTDRRTSRKIIKRIVKKEVYIEKNEIEITNETDKLKKILSTVIIILTILIFAVPIFIIMNN